MKQDELWYVLRQSSPRIVLPFWGRYHFDALSPLNFLLQRCDWLTVWTASPQTQPKRGFVVVILLGVTKKKNKEKRTPLEGVPRVTESWLVLCVESDWLREWCVVSMTRHLAKLSKTIAINKIPYHLTEKELYLLECDSNTIKFMLNSLSLFFILFFGFVLFCFFIHTLQTWSIDNICSTGFCYSKPVT